MSFVVELPWPPTANHYWKRNGSRYFISPKGIAFRDLTILACKDTHESFLSGERLSFEVDAYPPDKRRRDLDNILKATQDSLQKANVYKDDCQIDVLHVRRMRGLLGKVIVIISEI